jgi:hypothetical protein
MSSGRRFYAPTLAYPTTQTRVSLVRVARLGGSRRASRETRFAGYATTSLRSAMLISLRSMTSRSSCSFTRNCSAAVLRTPELLMGGTEQMEVWT